MSRRLTVAGSERVSPRTLRIHFESPDLAGFASPSPDDHLALFFSTPDGRELKRHYTPRAFDSARRRLSIDFFLHEGGVGSDWARDARPGDRLTIGGPKASRRER